jgi:hypothetical protein
VTERLGLEVCHQRNACLTARYVAGMIPRLDHKATRKRP